MTQSTIEPSIAHAERQLEVKPFKVLHVDDETGFLKVSKQILENKGSFKVDSAISVEEALEKMEKKTYDAIISDYRMPGKDGLQFLKELRSDGNNIPFVVLTGKSREEVAIEALNSGADHYLNKLGSPEVVYGEVEHAIKKAVKGRRTERAHSFNVQELGKSEQKYRNIVNLAPDGIITIDLKGVITSVNPTFLRLTGYPEKDVVGKHFTRLGTVRARDIPRYLGLMRSALKGKLPSKFEYSYVRKNGTIGWAEGHFSILRRDGKIVGFQGILREITERKKAMTALDESEKKYEILLEETPVGILNLDMKGKITFANKKFSQITGYSKQEFLDKNWLFLVRNHAMISEENLALIVKRLRNRLLKKTAPPFRVPLKRKDGSWIWVEGESKLIKKHGIPKGLQTSFRDVTDAVESDKSLKSSIQELKVLNEKLEVVGSLTRHDLRNKFSTMLGRIYLAKEKLTKDHEALADLDEIQSAISESERILNFASVYEILGIEELSYVTVSYSIQDAISLLPEAHSKLQGIKIVDETKELTVLSDSLLRQLFYNLIHNSIVHGEHVGKIIIRYKQNRDNLELIYEDDGVGILKAEKEKVFKEGYGKSTGFGLYLIKKMCEVYSWSIKETGKQGKGAQFTITMSKLNEQGKVTYKLN